MTTQRGTFDPAHSEIHFTVRHMVVSKVHGHFRTWNGTIAFDPTNPSQAETEVTIDTASVDTGQAERDTHLRSADFFDVQHHPKMTFKSTGIDTHDDTHFTVSGELTIRGIARPVSFEAEYHGQAKDPWGNIRAGFAAKTSISRKDFGLTYNQVLEAGGVLVGDKVDIELDVEVLQSPE